MQALVKVPHTLENGRMGEFKITGDVPVFYLDLTRRLFPTLVEETSNDDELVEVSKSDWYRKAKAEMTPGKNLRTVRELRELNQRELADKLGIKPRQISDMENGRASIGKKMAMKLEKALNMDYRHFL